MILSKFRYRNYIGITSELHRNYIGITLNNYDFIKIPYYVYIYIYIYMTAVFYPYNKILFILLLAIFL